VPAVTSLCAFDGGQGGVLFEILDDDLNIIGKLSIDDLSAHSNSRERTSPDKVRAG
jgi:hypothetical protein